MGLYDTIELDGWKLAEPPGISKRHLNSTEWQTKSLDCVMDEYLLRGDGKLYKKIFKWVKTPQDEYEEALKRLEKYRKKDGAFGYLVDIWVKQAKKKRVLKTLKDVKYHGILAMHGSIKGTYISYNLKFTDGNLVETRITEIS